MGEINHFSHEEHSLKLIENWETIVDDHGEKKGEVHCEGCGETISTVGGSAYGCISCRFFLHKKCAELRPTIDLHFHLFHPLTLIVHRVPWQCDVCRTHHLARRFSYCCLKCDFDACVKCGADHEELPPTINHHNHPLHPLMLNNIIHRFYCDLCGNPHQLIEGFSYRCVRCDFHACTKCGVVFLAQQVADGELKKEASIKLEHEGHPQHLLTLQLKPASFYCDACKTEEKDFFYQCDTCVFWIHKGCASLATTINIPHHPNHPLVLAYSLPERYYNYPYFCEFCDKRILQNDCWFYYCANCRYFAHIKCALKAEQPSVPRDPAGTSAFVEGTHLLHFPMSYKFTDPLKLLYSGEVSYDDDEDSVEINHWSHDHPLILNVEPQGNNMTDINSGDLIEVCYGCVRPLSFPYYSCSKDGCSFTLHKYCAQLPRTLNHQLHQYPLCLVNSNGWYTCKGCYSWGNTFAYRCEILDFTICINCAYLPNTIKHISHKHPLVQLIDRKHPLCKACFRWSDSISYACKACDFQLCIFCALWSPQSLAHRYCKGHDEVLLTYPPVENHPEDFCCDICEKEMHPKRPLYHCQKHKNSFHLRCLSRSDWYANIWLEGTMTVSYHKHPLSFVRRKKTPKYVCSKCNQDINGFLVLECRARVCDFNICCDCYEELDD